MKGISQLPKVTSQKVPLAWALCAVGVCVAFSLWFTSSDLFPSAKGPLCTFSSSLDRKLCEDIQEWKPWDLEEGAKRLFPTPPLNVLDPNQFHLHIKLLTFNRVNVTRRCLASLASADYLGDSASLEIFVDHPSDSGERWQKKSREEQLRALERRKAMLRFLDTVPWPHGRKQVHARMANAGVQPQWLEAWWPESVNEFAFIVEDDSELSPLYYSFLKRFVMRYYYEKANYDPHVFGISIMRQSYVSGRYGNFPPVYPKHHFLYKMVGTWGQIVLPIPWKEFRLWFEDNRYTAGRNPGMGNMQTSVWWYAKGNRIWTPWIVYWMHVANKYCLYPSFPAKLSLSVGHREAGENFPTTYGPDSQMITPQLLCDWAHAESEGLSAPLTIGSPSSEGAHGEGGPRAISPSEAMPGGSSVPATGLVTQCSAESVPSWWRSMPEMWNLPRYDFCFRRLPSLPNPLFSLEQLMAALPMFNATEHLVVVPVPGLPIASKLLQNWLCHVDGWLRQGYLLVFTLLPEEAVDGKCAKEREAVGEYNSEVVLLAQELTAQGHPVYVAPAAGSAPGDVEGGKGPSTGRSCEHQGPVVPREGTPLPGLYLTLPVAELVQQAVTRSVSVLLMSPGSLWRNDPVFCAAAACAKGEEGYLHAMSWFLEPNSKSWESPGGVVWLLGTKEGALIWSKVVQLWRLLGVPAASTLPPAAFWNVTAILRSQVLGVPPQKGAVRRTGECVTALPWNEGGRKRSALRPPTPSVLLAPVEWQESDIGSMKSNGRWELDDVHFMCKSIWCHRYRSDGE